MNYNYVLMNVMIMIFSVFSNANTGMVRNTPLNISYNMAQIKSTDLNHAATSGDGMYTIDLPGYYFLATDLLPTPANDGAACIKIAASNVTLDLNGKTIMQANGNDKNMVGIHISPNQSGVDIKNGSISDIIGTGILIDEGCTSVNLHILTIINCSKIGILAYKARNIELNELRVKKCSDSADGGPGVVGIKIQESSNIIAQHVKSNSHYSKTNAAIGFLLAHSANCTITDCDALNNSGAQSFGFYVDQQTSSCQFFRCNASGNLSNSYANGPACGFYFTDTDYHQINDSQSLANSAAKGNAYGFYIKNSRGSVIKDCSARGTKAEGTSGDAYGFYFESSASTKVNNCTSFSQVATSGNAYGYSVQNGRAHTFSECIAKDMDATAGTGNAFGFYACGGISNTFVKCQSTSNRSGNNTLSRCAGFALVQPDYFSIISECESSGNASGSSTTGGTACGVFFDGNSGPIIGAQVKLCTLANNVGKKSYGYCDTSGNSTTLLMRNISFGHGKCLPVDKNKRIIDTGTNNYLFSYDVSSKNPTHIITETHISNLQVLTASTPYMNLSIVND